MKRAFLLIVLFVLAAMTGTYLKAADYDFKYQGLYYMIKSISIGIDYIEVSVVPERATPPYYSKGNEPTGVVTIPYKFSREVEGNTIHYVVKDIQKCTFFDCVGLTRVNISNGITSIKELAFANCKSMTQVNIPKSITQIKDSAFLECAGLNEVSVRWDTPLVINANVFENVDIKNVTLRIPEGKESVYKAAAVWKEFKIEEDMSSIVLVSSVTLDHNILDLNNVSVYKLNATVQPAHATCKTLEWKSSNEGVATVDDDGLLNIIARGTTVITASAIDGSNKSDSCTVHVHSIVANETIDGVNIWVANGQLYLTLLSPQTVDVYHMSGALFRTFSAPAGNTSLLLPEGCYIVRIANTITKIMVR